MRIELTIEQMVLTGISAADADRVSNAIEVELTRILRQADPTTFTSGAVPSVRATMPTTPGVGPAGLGQALGAALGNSLTGGSRQ